MLPAEPNEKKEKIIIIKHLQGILDGNYNQLRCEPDFIKDFDKQLPERFQKNKYKYVQK